MIVEKVINNNIISTLDTDGNELIVMGRGIGFGKKTGFEVEENLIEKIFRLEDRKDTEKLKELLLRVPMEQASVVDDIVAYAKEKIVVKLNSSIYVTLTDHLNFAIERQRQKIQFENPLLWEIKRYYPSEFEVGEYACRLIQEKFDISLTADEAGFIALHFVNSEYRTSIADAVNFPVEIRTIMQMIQEEFHLQYDESSLDYERLLTHVKFLIQRLYRKELIQEEDLLIGDTVRNQCAKEYGCCKKIATYLESVTGVKLPEAEMTYMTIHIHRVLNKDRES